MGTCCGKGLGSVKVCGLPSHTERVLRQQCSGGAELGPGQGSNTRVPMRASTHRACTEPSPHEVPGGCFPDSVFIICQCSSQLTTLALIFFCVLDALAFGGLTDPGRCGTSLGRPVLSHSEGNQPASPPPHLTHTPPSPGLDSLPPGPYPPPD